MSQVSSKEASSFGAAHGPRIGVGVTCSKLGTVRKCATAESPDLDAIELDHAREVGRICEALSNRGLSLPRVAQLVGVSEDTLSRNACQDKRRHTKIRSAVLAKLRLLARERRVA